MSQNVLITGASGCVGHYLVETLAQHPEFRQYLLVRNRSKLQFNPDQIPNAVVIEADLGDFDRYAHLLPEMDYVVSLAAAWGDPVMTEQVNVEFPLRLFDQLDPQRCKRIIYFSTASILGRDNKPLPEAATIGTDYVRTKALCYQKLPTARLADRITVVCPTLILGGAKDKPYSHVCSGLPMLVKWFNLIQWVRSDGSFHFIHAQDIATIVVHLLSEPTVAPLLVLGNPNITVNECIEQACAYLGKKAPFTYNLTLSRALKLVKLLPISLAPWDEFCMHYKYFCYETVNAATFGLPVVAGTVKEALGMYAAE